MSEAMIFILLVLIAIGLLFSLYRLVFKVVFNKYTYYIVGTAYLTGWILIWSGLWLPNI